MDANDATKVKFTLGKRKVQKFVGTSLEKEEETQESAELSIETRVIPKLENTWKPEKLVKSDVKEFVSEVLPAGPMEGVQYGLSFLKPKAEASTSNGTSNHGNPRGRVSSVQKDILVARELRSRMDKQVLDDQLAELPDSSGLEAYETMPIENFGEALLRGMGWNKGEGIGRSATDDIVPTSYVRRPERLGLGATPASLEAKDKKKRKLKPGDSREKAVDLVAAPGPDGKVRNRVSLDEKLVERVKKGVYGGKVMCVVSGRHSGLRAKVLGDKDQFWGPGERVSIRLQNSDETVNVDAGELAEIGSEDEEQARKKLGVEKSNGNKKPKQSDSEEPRSWLTSQIRVRIVDKQLGHGKLYCKKGSVVDVVSRTACDVLMDETNTIHRVEQRQLETVVPKGAGGRVMVLRGEHRGLVAKLMSRDRKAEAAVVEIEQSLDVVTLSLDDIAEYTGEAGY